MKRYKQRHQRPAMRTLGLSALFAFAIFVSFKIFMPPIETIQVIPSPDGARTARLQHVYYQTTPGIKISVREKYIWKTLVHIPELKDAAANNIQLRWNSAQQLQLESDSEPVWIHRF